MSVSDQRILNYVLLADLSQLRQQAAGRDRFLLLAAIAACECGLPELAEELRRRVVCNNPHHLVARYDSMAAALRDSDFAPFQRHLQRFCSAEQAEFLLHQQRRAEDGVHSTQDLQSALSAIFSQEHWSSAS